ncbi:MAG: GYD domain-containing protein [Chloroflexota bacterium]
MAHFLVQASYTSMALGALARSPQDREQGFRALVDRLGGKVEAFFWAQGEFDLIVIVEMPDAEAANALSLAAVSPGHAKTYRTTPLFTNDEMMKAMKRAGDVSYQSPG